MGNYALIFPFAAVLGTSLLLYSTRSSTKQTDEALAEHTFKDVARALGCRPTVSPVGIR